MNPQLKTYLDRRGIEVVNEILDKKNGNKVVGYDCKINNSKSNVINGLYNTFNELGLDYSIAEPAFDTDRFSIYTNEA